MSSLPRTWVEISRAAVVHNLTQLRRTAGKGVHLLPILKANAYGHGLQEILTILRGQSYLGLGVAYGEEALRLRSLHYRGRVVVLSNWQPSDLPELIQHNVELVVWDHLSHQQVAKTGQRLGLKPMIHLKVDTGTTRIGFLPSQIDDLRRAFTDPAIRVVGIFSHLANAEEAKINSIDHQLHRFTSLSDKITITSKKGGLLYHLACTAAILRYPEAKFGLVRPGIGLYGLWPSPAIHGWCRANLHDVNFHPALTWLTTLVQVKTVSRGTAIGYGSTHFTKRKTTVGILPVGYADGYDRRLSNNGLVVIQGYRVKILGRVCMNLTMVDVTDIDRPKTGTKVTLLGPGFTADEYAKQTKSIHYEVTTRINWALRRVIC